MNLGGPEGRRRCRPPRFSPQTSFAHQGFRPKMISPHQGFRPRRFRPPRPSPKTVSPTKAFAQDGFAYQGFRPRGFRPPRLSPKMVSPTKAFGQDGFVHQGFRPRRLHPPRLSSTARIPQLYNRQEKHQMTRGVTDDKMSTR